MEKLIDEDDQLMKARSTNAIRCARAALLIASLKNSLTDSIDVPSHVQDEKQIEKLKINLVKETQKMKKLRFQFQIKRIKNPSVVVDMERASRRLLTAVDGECLDTSTTINDLPQEPLSRIFEMVVADSVKGFFCLKLCCKGFDSLIECDRFYTIVSFNTIPLFKPLGPCARQQAFTLRCEASGNPESMYMRGLASYCNGYDVVSGILDIKAASDMGYGEAAYALCIFQLFSPEITRKLDAVILLSNMKKDRVRGGRVVSYRNKLFDLLSNPMVTNSPLLHIPFVLCPFLHAGEDVGFITDDVMDCSLCNADVDVAVFSTIFPRM